MRTALISFFLLTWSFTGFSSNWIGISTPLSVPAKITMVSSTIDHSVVQFRLEGFNLREVQTQNGTAFAVELGKSTPILDAGAPDLPKLTASLIIPDQAGMSYRVISSEYKDFPDMMIAPSKGVIMRDTDPSTVPYQYGAMYSEDRFYPGSLAGTRDPYIIRDVRGQTLIAYPFQYNPVTKTLRVYYDLTLELYKTVETGINPMNQNIRVKKISQDFLSVYLRQFLNSDAMTNYTPVDDYGNLLVICYGPYMNAMQPYVDWKRAEGYLTEMINKDSAGATAAQIKTYIANYYNTKGLTHVLLVGDAPQIPTNTGTSLGGPSDNAYGYIVGNDHYADVFVGRFSAQSEPQVQTQVQRTLDYEINPQFLTEDWFSRVIGIGSDQGPGDDNEYDYQHIRNQQTQLLAYTYTWNPELFDGSQGGNDATGNPTPAMVTTEVNNGAGLILYCGHGSQNSWGTSGFSSSNVNQLTNVGKLPFIWSVACVNGDFTSGTCFAEAWLRASQGGQPTGAIAFLGSTINQSWDSPMEGQDEMTDILAESYPTNIKRTFAGLSINGCMKMIDSYGIDGSNMADTWTVFGDPTIMVRTAVPQPMAVSYDTILFVGDSLLSVYCGVNGARVTATIADTILATGLVVNDTAFLTFPALNVAYDTLHLVVTAYNMLPYQDYLVVRAIPVVAGFTGVPTRVIPGHTVNFTDTSTGNTSSWQWSFPGGNPSESTEKNPVITYNSIGTYDVKLIAGNGYFTDSTKYSAYIVVDFPITTGDMNDGINCTVLPNPTNGKFTLNLNGFKGEGLEITIYNMIGNIVYRDSILLVNEQLVKTINLAYLPDGVYFLKLTGKREMITRKIILRK